MRKKTFTILLTLFLVGSLNILYGAEGLMFEKDSRNDSKPLYNLVQLKNHLNDERFTKRMLEEAFQQTDWLSNVRNVSEIIAIVANHSKITPTTFRRIFRFAYVNNRMADITVLMQHPYYKKLPKDFVVKYCIF